MPAKSPIRFRGVDYDSKKSLCEAFGVDLRLFYSRHTKAKWPVAQALGLKKRPAVTADECNGEVYMLTNTKTKKSYIGLTGKSAVERFKEHVYFALHRGHQNKLAAAIRRHGSHSFKLKVLAKATSRAELAKIEKQMIRKYQTDINGYNTHEGGMVGGKNGKSAQFDGNTYDSVNAMCAAHNVTYGTYKRRLANGWSLEDALRGRKVRKGRSKAIVFRGKTYNSIKHFCEAHNHNYNTFMLRQYRGLKLEDNLAYVTSN